MDSIKEIVRSFLSKSPTKHTVLAGPLRGISLVTSWHDYPGALLGSTEKPLLEWFRHNVVPGETWLDVGAHYGYTAIALSRFVGPQGRVIAFEPVLSSAACLQKTKNINHLRQLQVVPLALSDVRSLKPIVLPIVRGMADSTVNELDSTETIYTISLDSIWPSLCGSVPTVHGIKIDVQGMEEKVLYGMQELLASCMPKLVIEFHRGANRNRIKGLLQQCGYDSVGSPIETIREDWDECHEDDKSYHFAPAEVNSRRCLEHLCEPTAQLF